MSSIKFDVYGRHVLISRTKDGWNIDFVSGEGKKRPAADIFIPDFISESEIEQYLADLCHEWATDEHPSVRRIN
ncbi:MAG: hypothetical protein PVH28_12875 [Desulfobacterales bacterium]|jgi:hypothetical protein